MICGIDLSLVALVGIVLLMGIVKKNAIMMVDFAIEAERTRGLAPLEAMREACLLRFRPIMMTTMAALLGALPLVLERGAGSELRYPLGVTIIGGLLLSQFLTLYTTPVDLPGVRAAAAADAGRIARRQRRSNDDHARHSDDRRPIGRRMLRMIAGYAPHRPHSKRPARSVPQRAVHLAARPIRPAHAADPAYRARFVRRCRGSCPLSRRDLPDGRRSDRPASGHRQQSAAIHA